MRCVLFLKLDHGVRGVATALPTAPRHGRPLHRHRHPPSPSFQLPITRDIVHSFYPCRPPSHFYLEKKEKEEEGTHHITSHHITGGGEEEEEGTRLEDLE